MKKFVIALIALFAVSAAQAQVKFGVRAAYELTHETDEVISNGSGFNAGVLANIPLVNGLYVEPGVSFFYDVNGLDYGVPEWDGSLRNPGLRVPLNFGYTFDLTPGLALAVYTGPQFNYCLSLKTYINGKEHTDLFANSDYYTKFDCQWGFGARVIYNTKWFAEIGGAAGITNLYKDAPKKLSNHRNNFTIGVGYLF